MKYKLFEVGGKIRDEILGLDSKDIDYTVVIEDRDQYSDPYGAFVEQIEKEGFDIFENKRSCFTVRSRFPENHKFAGLTADFVIARKELGYNPESRVPITDYGTLEDDLIRRDFTVNAVAKDIEGYLIDPFNGVSDIMKGILRTPGNTALSFTQDPLRILRAFRFVVTKDFYFSDDILDTIRVFNPERMKVVSVERIRNELRKMFKFDTKRSLQYLRLLEDLNPGLYNAMFKDKLWFEPTLSERRNKK